MPPKTRITKEGIVSAALRLVRENGATALNARSLAEELSCSTQPIFSNFSSMEELRLALIAEAMAVYERYSADFIGRGEHPTYKAAGLAYIAFAGEEREIFKLLFMQPKEKDEHPALTKSWQWSVSLAGDSTGYGGEEVTLFHLEMWVFVHGIATMVATGSLTLDGETVSRMLSDVYYGLRARFGGGENEGSH